MENFNSVGQLYHAYLVLDGSGSMEDNELKSSKPKHKAVASMVQELINSLHEDPQVQGTYLTVICYDLNNSQDVRLLEYDVQADTYFENTDLNLWDPILGHGGGTPIGDALRFVRGLAEEWIQSAIGRETRRAVIYVMSDGMQTHGTDPLQEKAAIDSFNNSSQKGRIRIAPVGYFQYLPGQSSEEDQGRSLLGKLSTNQAAFFESNDSKKIRDYVKQTVQSNMR